MRYLFTSFAVAIFFLTISSAPGMAYYEGYSRSAVNLRAGPGTNYPRVMTIRGNHPLFIEGCIEGWQWCAVESNGINGWVYARNLNGVYHNRRVRVIDSGPQLGIPFVVFEQRRYWDDHYRDRNFYRSGAYWTHDGYYNGRQWDNSGRYNSRRWRHDGYYNQ